MKKKIFKTYVAQEFNALDIEKSGKWYISNKVVEKRDRVINFEHYILAATKEEAIIKHKERYQWDGFNGLIDVWYAFGGYPCLNKKNPEFTYDVIAEEVHPSFDILKREMRSDEFLEYCRQEMFPLEVILCEKGE